MGGCCNGREKFARLARDKGYGKENEEQIEADNGWNKVNRKPQLSKKRKTGKRVSKDGGSLEKKMLLAKEPPKPDDKSKRKNSFAQTKITAKDAPTTKQDPKKIAAEKDEPLKTKKKKGKSGAKAMAALFESKSKKRKTKLRAEGKASRKTPPKIDVRKEFATSAAAVESNQDDENSKALKLARKIEPTVEDHLHSQAKCDPIGISTSETASKERESLNFKKTQISISNESKKRESKVSMLTKEVNKKEIPDNNEELLPRKRKPSKFCVRESPAFSQTTGSGKALNTSVNTSQSTSKKTEKPKKN
eukprot:CAMPEP_0167753090 /NCGR_PEP_ID=MMETSP0110_2-20121227/7513_1 /TAXON_ID=629695 /ORGANISM="Gymnochlora sp., Strain CCMP2014" /LENGTH=304 /DNA_ID=CAMNT_0007638803 /DNA_START=137 /DNA_END=1048 /DNA_ORIENTATION=-